MVHAQVVFAAGMAKKIIGYWKTTPTKATVVSISVAPGYRAALFLRLWDSTVHPSKIVSFCIMFYVYNTFMYITHFLWVVWAIIFEDHNFHAPGACNGLISSISQHRPQKLPFVWFSFFSLSLAPAGTDMSLVDCGHMWPIYSLTD